LEDDEDQGEIIEIEDDESEIEDLPDGGALVSLGGEEVERSTEFMANLADTFPEAVLSSLATEYLELLEKDKEARKLRDLQYEDGLKRTGLGNDAPGGADFEGASRAVHPMITEATVDFAARAMKELWPPAGPAKDKIEGRVTTEKVEKAKRKTQFMNWQLTVQATEARAEVEQLLTQLPLGGSQYLKVTWNEKRNRPNFLFVAIDDMLLPYAATNFYTSQRKTHVQYLTHLDYQRRVDSGMYRDVDLPPASQEPEGSVAEQANNKIEGRESTSYNTDGLRTVYEIYVNADLEEDEKADGIAPYILTVDSDTRRVLALYRNWDEFDDSREELDWFVEFAFIPWRGAYAIGLPQMIGGLAAAATGALRALLDSAHINNSQTMLKLKGATTGRGGQTLGIQPTQIIEIEGGLATDDIRKLAMPLPFNPPSTVLFSMLGFLVDAAKGVIRTSLEDFPDVSADSPVGTTLARMEQGMVVFSSIHARLHDSMARMLRVLHRLDAFYLDDEKEKAEVGEVLASRKDFVGPMDVVPVSDPNIFSEAQRYAQTQAVAARADTHPEVYNQRAVEKRILHQLKIPNPDELLGPDLQPVEENAVNENVFASTGRALLAFPRQDHMAHIKTHLGYMANPVLGMSELIAPTYLPVIVEHLKQHIAMWYAASVREIANYQIGGDISEIKEKLKSDKDKQAFDRLLAEASQLVSEEAAQVFGEDFQAFMQQAQKMVQTFQTPPAPPLDPAAALNAQVQQQLGQMRQQIEQMKLMQKDGVDKGRLALDEQRLSVDSALKEKKIDQSEQAVEVNAMTKQDAELAEDRRTAAEIDAKLSMNLDDNRTALSIAEANVAVKKSTNLTTGTGIDPGN